MSVRSDTELTTMRYFLALLAVVAWAGVAEAQGPGIRGGVSVDPDQFYVGAHYETGALVDRLHFRPNVEAGFGDDLTTIALNFEFAYKFPHRRPLGVLRRRRAGGELLLVRHRGRRRHRHRRRPQLHDWRRAELRAVLRVQDRAIDSPELKFGVGWTFR